VFTARYGLIPYIKQITFRFLKVKRPGLNLRGEAVWLMMISYDLVDQGFDSWQ